MTIVINTSLEGEIDNWNTLQDYITEETDGRANSEQLAAYIRRAEGRIRRALAIKPVPPMQVSTSITVQGETLEAPTDMVRPFALELNDGDNRQEIEFIARENLTALQAANVARNMTYQSLIGDGYYPRYYTLIDQTFRFWPAQSASLSGTLYYYQQLPSLSESNQTNWLLIDHPDVYLDGALYYAYRAMPDIEKASIMKDIFEQSLAEALESYPDPANRMTLMVDPALSFQRYRRFDVSTY